MPRYPGFSPITDGLKGSVYSQLAGRLSAYTGEVYPLHIGDTWREPAEGCRMEDLTVADHPGMHRYAPVAGLPELRAAIGARLLETTGLSAGSDEILVTAGATAGLAAVCGAIVEPGDEVLILAPFWPLIAGCVRTFGGVPVPVDLLAVDSAEQLTAAIEAARTARTVALYVNTPNNPTGRVLPRAWIEALATWARAHDQWLVSDEVYEHYVYEGEHVYARPFAPERTFSAYSFSKAYGMAGNRCAYVVGPAEAIARARSVSTHTFYSAPTASQLAAVKALAGPGERWAEDMATRYAEVGRAAAERLGVAAAEGSTFLFIDVAEHLDDRGLVGLLSDCVDEGLLLAPGPRFGPYPTHVRLCFTAAAPDMVSRGVEVLAAKMGR